MQVKKIGFVDSATFLEGILKTKRDLSQLLGGIALTLI
jgi:hypothetical protein